MVESVFVAESLDGRSLLRIRGRVDLMRDARAWVDVRRRIDRGSGGVTIDLADARIDDGVLALILAWREDLSRDGRELEIVNPDATATHLLDLLAKHPRAPDAKGATSRGFGITALGALVVDTIRRTRGAVVYVGEVVLAVLSTLRHPSRLNWRDLPRLISTIGADALPIVLAINFLVGVTLAYMGAIQLEQFGADIFVADMVAIAVARSLGPLMSAIIVAGRSGAGIAAELGTMKVSEEIDALRVLGLDPMKFLVLPRVMTIAFVFPLLTIAGELAAMAGGLLIGVTDLGLTPEVYIERTHDMLTLQHVGSGLVKAFCFGLAIVLIACHRGLATEGGAEGVGTSTTQSVVQIIFQIVVLESFFTVLFNFFGI